MTRSRLVARLALAEGPKGPLVRRSSSPASSSCGPVMAKGVEDTRSTATPAGLAQRGRRRPGRFGVTVDEFHGARRQRRALAAGDDDALHPRHQAVRGRPGPARPAVAVPDASGARPSSAGRRWAPAPRDDGPDAATESSCARPSSAPGRCRRTGRGVRREGDPGGQGPHVLDRPGARVRRGGRRRSCAACSTTARSWREVEAFVERLRPAVGGDAARPEARAADDARRGRHLPGHRAADLSLVDPDNRRPVDSGARRGRLADAGAAADAELRRRRDCAAAAPRAPRARSSPARRTAARRPGRGPRLQPAGRGGHGRADPRGARRARRLGRRRRRPARGPVARVARAAATRTGRCGWRTCSPTCRSRCSTGRDRALPGVQASGGGAGQPHDDAPRLGPRQASRSSSRSRRARHAMTARRRLVAGRRARAGRAPTTPSSSTAASPGPTRAAPGSRTASTARRRSSTTTPSRGPTALARPAAAGRRPLRAARRDVHARGHVRRRRSSGSTTSSSSGSTPSSCCRATPSPARGAGATTGSPGTPSTTRTAARTGSSASSTPATRAGSASSWTSSTTTSGRPATTCRSSGPYLTEAHTTPWGPAVNLDRPGLRRGPPLHRRQRPDVAARLPRRRAAARRRARPRRRARRRTCSRSWRSRSRRSAPSWASRCGSSPRATSTTRGW